MNARDSQPKRPRPRGARKVSSRSKQREVTQTSEIEQGFVESFDGTKIFYSAEGSGPPLVFCYGLVCSSLHWTYQIEHFRKNYRSIWVDYRGHQNSEAPQDFSTLTLESVSKDVIAVLDHLGVRDAVFLGHSMGVNVVLEILSRQPERVRAMVLANGTPKSPLETLFGGNGAQAFLRGLSQLNALAPGFIQRAWKYQKGNPLARLLVTLGGFNPHLTAQDDVQLYIDQIADMSPEIFIRLISNYAHYDATAWLHTIQVPTMIIAGEQDRVTPIEQQELLHQLIPASRMERIRHGSHCPQMDLPDLVNDKIESFLREISYASQANPTKESASRPNETHRDRDLPERA
jgi:pimeloyl-ACP methyl ester carboxylesterase